MFRSLIRYLTDTIALALGKPAPSDYDYDRIAADSQAQLQAERVQWANDTAANLRMMGHPCPVGTVLAGITVTR